MKKAIIIFIVLFVFTVLANAVTILQVEGVVTSIDEYGGYSFDDSIQVGTTFTESYYFLDLTDISSDPELGDYIADYSILSIGNCEFSSSSGGLLILAYEGNKNRAYSGCALREGRCEVYVNGEIYEYSDIIWRINGSGFDLVSSLPDIPDTDEFPFLFPDLSVFDSLNRWSFSSYLDNPAVPDDYDGISIKGRLTSIEVVPEPCSVLLLGVGGVAVMRRRK